MNTKVQKQIAAFMEIVSNIYTESVVSADYTMNELVEDIQRLEFVRFRFIGIMKTYTENQEGEKTMEDLKRLIEELRIAYNEKRIEHHKKAVEYDKRSEYAEYMTERNMESYCRGAVMICDSILMNIRNRW